ncbi:MAG: hypothetical protein JO257_24870 [Deltaproteobacteria bacterium]|nr:hypothetical protein [Deltaproteobacteria bacterium]
MRGIVCLYVCAALAACGEDHSTTIKCGAGTMGTLTQGGSVEVMNGQDLTGAAIAADAHVTLPTAAVSIACTDDIAPTGFTALGPAVTFGADGTWSDRPFDLTLPYKAARLPKNAPNGAVRIVAKPANGPAFFPAVTNRTLDDKDAYASRAAFRASELMTYQVVAATDAGTARMETFGGNAIIGVSMGGNAAMTIGLKHPDKFDVIVDLGGEPGPSMIYSLDMVRTFLFGGFCTKDDEAAGRGMVGQLCPAKTNKPEQHEIESDYEHMVYQMGDGVGLTLSRNLYMKASRDLGRALGNPALYNPQNAYAPPGVDFSFFAQDAATRCANPVVLRDFHDREFNPDGSKPVITFCDGGDMSPALGVFNPQVAQTNPAELLLAVDLNNNGKRDSGEPVITNAYEPFSDVGTDGKADKDEPGYDPVTNPDPNHDDYHYLKNPLGTEGNGNYDMGEPYEDVGIDGVASTCQAGSTPPTGVAGCYDYGEGNGHWDLSPNVKRWYDSDLQVRLAALTSDQRRHVSMWFDAGIRDFLNAGVSANQAVGQAMATGELPFSVYDTFGGINPGSTEATYDFTETDWKGIAQNGFLRYGNPDASASDIMNGDGRHVGTANEIIYRIETGFSFIDHRLPDGDRDDALDGGVLMKGLTFTSPHTGRMSPYALSLPPGYNDPANANKRYPVVYVLHGYGQQPDDLIALSAIIANHMIATEPLATRIQKLIIVYVDGRCRPDANGVPVPTGGDGCEGGTFYLDTPLGGTAQMETNLLDLMAYIDATYRTRGTTQSSVSY